jgi:signal transduction histidine kinase
VALFVPSALQPSGADGDPLRDLAEDAARIASENTRLLQRLAEGERRLRLISRSVVRVQEGERGRISRELHDEVGQALTALKMQIELAEQIAVRERSAVSSRLAEVRELADRTLQEVRQISHLLRPQMLDELGLVPTLQWLVRTFRQRTGVEVELAHEGLEDPLDAEVGTLVFRVVQEALTNIARHARATSAQVRLRRTESTLSLLVEDRGVGFDAERVLEAEEDRGFGIRGMRDRVRLFGGRFTLRSSPGKGSSVEVEVPLEPEGIRS